MQSYDDVLDRVPSLDDIQATVDLADSQPEKANTEIVAGYFALSDALGRVLHGDVEVPENATFLTFAAWAAESLRLDVVRPADGSSEDRARPGDLLRPARRMYRRAAREVLQGDDAIVRNILRGQAAVYQEIASAHHKLLNYGLDALAAIGKGRDLSESQCLETWKKYSADLRDMHTPINSHRATDEVLDRRDVYVLQRALQPYFEVFTEGLSTRYLSESGKRHRAQLILLANVRTVAYEQKRLQPVLVRNLDYVPEAIRARAASELMGRQTLLDRMLRKAYVRSEMFQDIAREAFQIAATRGAYSMVVGTEDLRFGRDLPMPPAANPLLRSRQAKADERRYGVGAFFPYALENLQMRPVWAEWQRHDRSAGEGARTAVDNWLRYGERLNFLVNLFRSRQQLTALYEAPRSIPVHALSRRSPRLLSALRTVEQDAQSSQERSDEP